MRHKLIIDGNAVYEIDDECMNCRKEKCGQKEIQEGTEQTKEESLTGKNGTVIKKVQAL